MPLCLPSASASTSFVDTPPAAVLDGQRAQRAAPTGAAPSETLDEVERRHILVVLNQTGWRIDGSGGAARILAIHPNTLRSRMKKLGIRRDGDRTQ